MTLSRQLLIERSWDGQPLPGEEVVSLSLSTDAERLTMEFDAPFAGDPPPSRPPGDTWKLWEHEVVELFICGPGERYTEIEIGPFGHFLVLQLEGVRNIAGRLGEDVFSLEVEAPRRGRWQAKAQLQVSALPPKPWRLNAYRISGVGDSRAYAAAYPSAGDAPDFHRLDAFQPW